MSVIHDAVNEHAQNCKSELPKKFVTWVWLVGILIGALGGVGTVAWCASARFTRIEAQSEQQVEKIAKLESIYDDVRWMRRNWGTR